MRSCICNTIVSKLIERARHIRFIKKQGVDFSKHFINGVDETQEKSEPKNSKQVKIA